MPPFQLQMVERFRLNRELERKYHVENPRRKENEIVYRRSRNGMLGDRVYSRNIYQDGTKQQIPKHL
jgi:hypothetical protein